MKPWFQTLMDAWINIYNMYIQWCIMYKCSIQTYTYGGVNGNKRFCWKIWKNKNKNSHYVFLTWHVVKKIIFLILWLGGKKVVWWCGHIHNQGTQKDGWKKKGLQKIIFNFNYIYYFMIIMDRYMIIIKMMSCEYNKKSTDILDVI